MEQNTQQPYKQDPPDGYIHNEVIYKSFIQNSKTIYKNHIKENN